MNFLLTKAYVITLVIRIVPPTASAYITGDVALSINSTVILLF